MDSHGVGKPTKSRGGSRRSLATVGLAFVDKLTRQPDGLGISELARSVDIDVAQSHRIVRELMKDGWISQAKANAPYRLTGKLLGLAAEQLRHSDLRTASARVMRHLKQEIGETVVLAEFRNGGLLCIARELSDAPIVAWSQIGDRWDLGSAAAVAVAVESAAVASGQEDLLPPDYVLSMDRRSQLDEALTRGWSFDGAKYVTGGSAVGAPILDFEARPLGALAVGWPTVRGDDDAIERFGRLVRAAADEISAELGSTTGSDGSAWRAIEREREDDLFRHLADLRVHGYEGAFGREETLVRFRSACAFLEPVVEEVMGVISTRLLDGQGHIEREETETEVDGLAVSWQLHWPEQERAVHKVSGSPLEPITVVGRLRQAHIHGHLGGSYFGDWPMQIVSPRDARRQAPAVLSIIEAEIHQRVFEAGGAWNLIPAYYRAADGTQAALRGGRA